MEGSREHASPEEAEARPSSEQDHDQCSVGTGEDADGGSENAEADESGEEDAEGEAAAEDEDGASSAELTLEDAARLYEQGCNALRADDLDRATDLLSRCLEIRARHFGELAIECASTYYKYGCALLYKAQGESDALNVPESREKQAVRSTRESPEKGEFNGAEKGNEEEVEELEEEEESELDMAWKMLDIARAIHEKQQSHSIEEVDVITALADVSLEREDFEMCFRDYTRALEILEGLVEPDSRRIAELCFKLSLAQQLGYKPKEALNCCQQAVFICEARLRRFRIEVAEVNGSVDSKGKSLQPIDTSNTLAASPDEAQKPSVSIEKEEEIKEIEQLLVDLREKVAELEEMAAGPSLMDTLKETNPGVVSSIQQVLSAATKVTDEGTGNGCSNGATSGFDAPSALVSAPVTDLGVVGRGVKRATPVCVSEASITESCKKRSLDDLMTGGRAGDTLIGFGSTSADEDERPSKTDQDQSS